MAAAKQRIEVLVVGAGPVGLFLAVLLADRGVNVKIIDREKRTNVHSYALALHPQSIRLLESIGLSSPLIERGHWVEKLSFYDDEECRIRLSLDELEGKYPFALVQPQAELEMALERKLREKGLQILWDNELTDFQQTGEGVRLEIGRMEDIPQGYPILTMQRMRTGTDQLQALYVVGADGYHSFVRRKMGIHYEGYGTGKSFSVYEFEADANMAHEMRVILGEKSSNVLWPMGSGRYRWSFEIVGPANHDPSVAGLTRLIKERAPWFGAWPKQVLWSTTVRFEQRLADTFGRDRVWLAGDAGHLTGPVGAQSMNMGLQEAHELSWRLFEVLRRDGSKELLDEYSQNRRLLWEKLLLTDVHLKAEESIDPWVRKNAERILASMPVSDRDLDKLLSPLQLKLV